MNVTTSNARKRSARNILASLPFVFSPTIAMATDFTAGIVATEMDEGDRYPYMAGIIEGLAYARFAREGSEEPGMKCIYAWFYDDKDRPFEILEVFKAFPDYLPGAVIAAMLEKDCGG